MNHEFGFRLIATKQGGHAFAGGRITLYARAQSFT